MARFEDCLAFVLPIEGGFVNDPVDRGGATNKGITQRVYDAWRVRHGLPKCSVAEIEDQEVEVIYREEYWTPLKADRFDEPLDLVLFDSAVNHGVSRAAKLLQTALAITADGVVGMVTLAAAMAEPVQQLAMDVLTARANFYADIIHNKSSQAKFVNGWINRLEALKKEIGVA